MENIWVIIKEQILNFKMIFRIASYEKKASYDNSYLGLGWEIINPILQTYILFIIFGTGLRAGRSVNFVPFFSWMIIGKTCWFYMNGCILSGINSIKNKLTIASKMKFPLSILPTITMVRRLDSFFVMLILSIIIARTSGITPSIYWLQFIYYFLCMVLFIFAVNIFTTTVTILIGDFEYLIVTIMRFAVFVSGVMIPLEEMTGRLGAVLRLNPFFYIINGFRFTFLTATAFYSQPRNTLIFWSIVLFFGITGSHLHLKYRHRLTDFI